MSIRLKSKNRLKTDIFRLLGLAPIQNISGMSQNFCKLFWQFKILKTLHNFYENSNIEIRPFYWIGRNNIEIRMFKIQNKFGPATNVTACFGHLYLGY